MNKKIFATIIFLIIFINLVSASGFYSFNKKMVSLNGGVSKSAKIAESVECSIE